MMEHIIVFVTAKDVPEAELIARSLVEKRLAACCNIVKDIHSVYWWQDNIEESSEAFVMIKTRRDLFKLLEAEVKALHSYTMPEILAIPVVDGNSGYLQWVDEATTQ
ncbi:MAG: divalent-cation tolerance protein CutA [Candidatus Omnitrophica bacterium]|nr:divalent-cation tolerance protein CutA [Candidatus Omnitrophota bacterium]